MTKEIKQKLTLGRPATYRIKVLGKIDVSQTDWTAGLKVTIESDGRDPRATTLCGELDQRLCTAYCAGSTLSVYR